MPDLAGRPACTCGIADEAGALHYRECPLYELDAPLPGPDDEVLVRYGDLAALEIELAGLRDSLTSAKEDLRLIQVALGVPGEDGITAHQLVVSHLLPAIRRLIATQSDVDAASAQIMRIAGAAGGPELDLGDGRKAKLVGRRLPKGMLSAGGKHIPPGKHRKH